MDRDFICDMVFVLALGVVAWWGLGVGVAKVLMIVFSVAFLLVDEK